LKILVNHICNNLELLNKLSHIMIVAVDCLHVEKRKRIEVNEVNDLDSQTMENKKNLKSFVLAVKL
jgi:predicted transposase YbfD/YdcC